MNFLTRKLVIATAAALTFAGGTSESHATRLTLDGSGFYRLGSGEAYYERGARQSGRYRKLGADYYHKATIGMDRITNRSKWRSGDMSFELWAMNYYKSTSGIILMTRSLNPLRKGYLYRNKERRGHAISLNRRRHPELSLWEFTRRGWKWRDSLSFNRKRRL